MSASDQDRARRLRGVRIGLFFIPLFFGLQGFYRVSTSPHFQSYRTIDVVQLILTGACLGAFLVGLMVTLLGPRR